ncbi:MULTISPECIES: ankyrin repeat domain-containing protein [Candidatus Cardinium]|uniref:ankyrin repeat domain-containing protein n=1 Tax=Candidatus Cardinium TaxID=273135 RepID=UPI001FAA9C0A|nr:MULTISPECIES: ankyrin repeat domain-containing protein [Cardinium]
MNLLVLVQDKLQSILHGVILISIVTCSKVPFVLSVRKRTQEAENRSSKPNKQASVCRSKTSSRYLGNELHWAVIHCDAHGVERVFQYKSVNRIKRVLKQNDSWGVPPVYWCLNTNNVLDKQHPARGKNYLSIFEHFLDNPHFNLFIRDKFDRNLLHWIVINKNLEALQLILAQFITNHSAKLKKLIKKDSFGYPPLHYLVVDHLDTWTKAHSAILKYFLEHDLGDVNAKDAEYLPLLYWLIYYNQSKLAAIVLASQQLETFRAFISNALDQSCSPRFGRSHRPLTLKQLLASVKAILEVSVKFLKTADQVDTDVINTKKMLLNRYFGVDVCNQPINGVLDILKLILESYKFEKAIKRLQQNPLLDELKEDIEDISKIFDCPIYNAEQGNGLILDSKPVDEQKVKDFIKETYKKYKSLEGYLLQV